MAIMNIPTGNLPYEVVDELPVVGELNKIYGLNISDDEIFPIYEDYTYYGEEWHKIDLSARVFGFLFQQYQESVVETVAEMEQTIAEQAALIEELEEEVFPIVNTSFEMMITSLMQVELDLYDSNDNIIPNMGFSTEVWDVPEEVVYQNEVRKGTYYLKNADGYALGTAGGEIVPLVCDGTTVDLGNVEIIMIGGAK